jgi:thymidylate synthase (FAD)
MCEIKFHVKLPIFVARQWIRHRTANVNEYSARYSILDREFYVPDREFLEARRAERKRERKGGKAPPDMFPVRPKHLAAQARNNRQGREELLPDAEAEEVLRTIKAEAARDYTVYLGLLNEDAQGRVIDPERHGLARELARMVLPANVYTQWYWKIDLHNLMHFLSLRADPHAQYEIRAYADAMLGVLKRWVPIAYAAFVEHRLEAATLSATALKVVRRMLSGENISEESSGLKSREWRELMAVLGREA